MNTYPLRYFFLTCKKMGHIDDLPISNGLKDELFLWDKEYQATFNDDYPPDSGFSSIEDEIRHKNVGLMLAKKCKRSLRVDI